MSYLYARFLKFDQIVIKKPHYLLCISGFELFFRRF
jgi:hypothetical protein